MDILKSMFGMNGFAPVVIDKLRFSFFGGELKLSMLLLLGAVILLCLPNSNELSKRVKPNLVCGIITFTLLLLSVLQLNKISEFLYFQF